MRRSGVSIRGFQAPRVRPAENVSESTSVLAAAAAAASSTSSLAADPTHKSSTNVEKQHITSSAVPSSSVVVAAVAAATPSASDPTSPDTTLTKANTNERDGQAGKSPRAQSRKRSRTSDSLTNSTNKKSRVKDTATNTTTKTSNGSSNSVVGPLRSRQSREAAHRVVYYPPVRVASTAALSTSTTNLPSSSLAMDGGLSWYDGEPRGDDHHRRTTSTTAAVDEHASYAYSELELSQRRTHPVRSAERALGVQDTVVWPAHVMVQQQNNTGAPAAAVCDAQGTGTEDDAERLHGELRADNNTTIITSSDTGVGNIGGGGGCGESDFLRALEFAFTQQPTPPLPSQLPLNEVFRAITTTTTFSSSASPSRTHNNTTTTTTTILAEPSPPTLAVGNANPATQTSVQPMRCVGEGSSTAGQTPEACIALSALSAPDTARALVFSATQLTNQEDKATTATVTNTATLLRSVYDMQSHASLFLHQPCTPELRQGSEKVMGEAVDKGGDDTLLFASQEQREERNEEGREEHTVQPRHNDDDVDENNHNNNEEKEEEDKEESDEALAQEVAEEMRMSADLPFTPNQPSSCEAARERVGIYLSQSSSHAMQCEANGEAGAPVPTSQQLSTMVAVMLTPHTTTTTNDDNEDEVNKEGNGMCGGEHNDDEADAMSHNEADRLCYVPLHYTTTTTTDMPTSSPTCTPCGSQSTRTQRAMQRVRTAASARASRASCTPDYLRALERAQRESMCPTPCRSFLFGLSQPPNDNDKEEEQKQSEQAAVEDKDRKADEAKTSSACMAEMMSAIATGMVLTTGIGHQNRTTFRFISKQQQQPDLNSSASVMPQEEDKEEAKQEDVHEDEHMQEEEAGRTTNTTETLPVLLDENSREVMDERSNSAAPTTTRPKRTCFVLTRAAPALPHEAVVHEKEAAAEAGAKTEVAEQTSTTATAVEMQEEKRGVREEATSNVAAAESAAEEHVEGARHTRTIAQAEAQPALPTIPATSTLHTVSLPMTVMNDGASLPASSPSPSIQPPPQQPPQEQEQEDNHTLLCNANVAAEADTITPNTFYDLPMSTADLFARLRGVRTLYDWQHQVLTRGDVRSGGNFIYSLPTSGGKTLVAEILLLRCILLRHRSCLFVLPFVSLAEEKTTALQPFGDALGFTVDGHYGMTGRFPLPKGAGPTLFVCTIEKANSVLNHLLDEGAEEEIGAVVVDELHMLGESRRGATLELFLSKLLLVRAARLARYNEQHKMSEVACNTLPTTTTTTTTSNTTVSSYSPLQLIGMSATVSNLPALAAWLQASYYESHHRPVPLRQYSVVEGMVLREGERNERNLSGSTDLERLFELVTEVPEASVLVFCASRQQCVDTARGVVRYLQLRTASSAALAVQDFTSGSTPHAAHTTNNSADGRGDGNQALNTLLEAAAAAAAMPAMTLARLRALPPHAAGAIEALLSELYSSSHQEAAQLAEVVPYGVAFHHGGLLAEERELIERAYRNKHLRVLCCTSTLAAGVNLPARRVIFKTPYIGRDFLTRARYLQMAGRAGRAGLDPYGESFLLLSRRDRARGHRLMHERLEPCSSQMLEDAGSFSRALLECVGVRLVRSVPAAQQWGCVALLGRYAAGPIDPALQQLLRAHQQHQQQHHQRVYVQEEKQEGDAKEGADSKLAALPLSQEKTMQICLQHTLSQLVQCGLVRQELVCGEPAAKDTAHPTAPNNTNTNNTSGEEHGEEELCVPVMQLEVTPFGASAVRSCFSVEEAVVVRAEFDQLRQTGLILADDLHLCYFLTPLREVGNCDWELFRVLLSRLNDTRQYIASLIGVDEYFVDQRAMGLGGGGAAHAVPTSEEGKRKFFVARRFYVALMLADVLSEVPMQEIESRYNVSRGQLQSLMRSASLFSSSITSFCHAMEWYSLEAVLASFVKRLDFGVKPDLVPLMEIHGVQPARARALWLAGFRDPTSIATCSSAEDMVAKVKKQNPPESKVAKFFTVRSAVRLIREATALLQNQIRTRRGELQALATRVSHAPEEEPGLPV